jgi:hypothetical protein
LLVRWDECRLADQISVILPYCSGILSEKSNHEAHEGREGKKRRKEKEREEGEERVRVFYLAFQAQNFDPQQAEGPGLNF